MLRSLLLFVLTLPLVAAADGFQPVREKSRFLDLVQNRELQNGRYSLAANVLPDGRIAGTALGKDITGQWTWQNGYFCPEMYLSGEPVDYNCLLVEAQGAERLRFTVDRGKGDSATFQLH
jgi:hypothetical protein